MAPHAPVTILIVDDEPSLVRALVVALGRDGYKVESADNGQSALELIALCRYDVILCDLRMPELDGSAFYSRLLHQYPSLQRKVIFLTGDTLSAESMAAIPAHSHGTSVSHVSYMVCEGMDQAFCLDAYQRALKRRGPMGGDKQGYSVL
jgi:CheY-like chemotaxis protein